MAPIPILITLCNHQKSTKAPKTISTWTGSPPGPNSTREEPIRAVSIAFFVGLVLTLLPIGGIIAGLLRLAFGLVRPALLILGATKVYEEIQKRQ